MRSLSRGLVSALAAVTIVGSALVGLGTSAAHAGPATRAGSTPSLSNVRVPASCGHPATRLNGYVKNYPRSNGHTTLDVDQAVTGQLGRHHDGPLTLVPLSCSAHGKAWPDLVLAYEGRRLFDTIRLRTLIDGQAHAEVSDLSLADRRAHLTVTTSNANGSMRTVYHAAMGAGLSRGVNFSLGQPLTIDAAPTDMSPGSGSAPSITGRNQSNRFKPAPDGLRAFLQQQKNSSPHVVYVRLERYSSHDGGYALVDWNPGDEEESVAAKVRGEWRWIATYYDRGDVSYACYDGETDSGAWNELDDTTRPAWIALGLACKTHGAWATLSTWPDSGL